MSKIKRWITIVVLSVGMVAFAAPWIFAQDAPAVEPTPAAAAAPVDEVSSPAVAATAESASVSTAKSEIRTEGLPGWLGLLGKAWPVILTLLLTVVLVKFVKDEGWKRIVSLIIHGMDEIYLAYVGPAKKNGEEWDPAEARARAWIAAKAQAGPIFKLIFALKGKKWGETLVHRIVNARTKGKTTNVDTPSTS